jgi:hypothetical protein
MWMLCLALLFGGVVVSMLASGFTSPPKEGMPYIFSPQKSDCFGQHANHYTTEAALCCVTDYLNVPNFR